MSENNLKSIPSSGSDRKDAENKKRPAFLSDIRDKKKGKLISLQKPTSMKQIDSASMQVITADDLKDPDWITNNPHVDLVTTSLSQETSVEKAEEADKLKQHQKKHQINWLAQDTRHKDIQLLEKSAQGKQKQRSSALKYGW